MTHFSSNTPNGLNLEQIRLECKQLVKSRAKISAGVAIIPIPFLDVAVDVGMLSQLLPDITKRFGLTEEQDPSNIGSSDAERKQNIIERVTAVGGLVATRGLVNKTIQGFGGRFIGKQVSKYIPLGGQMVAATIGYMIFKKIADDHVEQCYKVAKEAQNKKTAI